MAKLKTPIGDAPVIPLIILMTGAYLTWFGIHYWGTDTRFPTDPLKNVLQGNPPGKAGGKDLAVHATLLADTGALQPDAGGSPNQPGVPGTAIEQGSGSAIANDALKYKGAGYIYGGNASSPGNWDCSSFVSYVLGHDLNMALPGGKWGDPGFPPHSHGPTTLQYLLFGQPINLNQVQAGDLIVSTEHIGIAISGSQMISAQDPRDGTGIGNFPAGFPAGPPHYRRVAGSTGTTQAKGSTTAAGRG